MKLLMLCCVLFLLTNLALGDPKRGGGGSRGGGTRSKTSGGSSWWWSSSSSKKGSSSSSSSSSHATSGSAVPAPKASAPHEVKKQTSHVQQQPASNPHYNQQTPIGWNVGGNKQGSGSTGISSWFNRQNKQQSSPYKSHSPWITLQGSKHKQRTSTQGFQAPKPSAPRLESSVRKPSVWGTNTGKQNSQIQKSPNSKLENINRNNPKTNLNNKSIAGSTHQQSSGNQPHGAWPNTGQHNQKQSTWGTQQGNWGGQQHGSWGNQQQGGWGGQQHGGWGSQSHGGWGGQSHGGWGGQSHGGWGGGYPNHGYSGFGGGYGGGYNSYGGMQRGGFMGGYGGGMGGYGGGMGGYGGGMGGYGMGMGMGGLGGMGGYGGYGMQRKSGFFSGGSTIGNILTGMAIYHVTSSLVKGIFGTGQSKRPYNVYNYYNQPPEAREEIKLPSNMLSMCEGNLTTVCTGATAICTTNNTVLCVVTMSQATPCADEKAMCINTTIPCADKSDPLCQNITQQATETTVNLPCYTNLSVDINLLNEPGAAKTGDDYQYCVTTMAVAGPDYSACSEESISKKYDYRNVLEGDYTWNLTVTPMMRKYQSYNYDNPTQTPSGELVLPLTALIPCIENATKVCAPDLVVICTGFGEIMCIQTVATTTYCEEYNTTCQKSIMACQEDIEQDFLCQNTTEEEFIIKEEKKYVSVEMPCFANITINTNIPNFDINTFNGTIPAVAPSSFMYNYHFCLITLSIPGPETDMCLIDDGNEKQKS